MCSTYRNPPLGLFAVTVLRPLEVIVRYGCGTGYSRTEPYRRTRIRQQSSGKGSKPALFYQPKCQSYAETSPKRLPAPPGTRRHSCRVAWHRLVVAASFNAPLLPRYNRKAVYGRNTAPYRTVQLPSLGLYGTGSAGIPPVSQPSLYGRTPYTCLVEAGGALDVGQLKVWGMGGPKGDSPQYNNQVLCPIRSLKHENPGFCNARPSIKQVADYLVRPGRQSQIIYPGNSLRSPFLSTPPPMALKYGGAHGYTGLPASPTLFVSQRRQPLDRHPRSKEFGIEGEALVVRPQEAALIPSLELGIEVLSIHCPFISDAFVNQIRQFVNVSRNGRMGYGLVMSSGAKASQEWDKGEMRSNAC
ncbi:hypothetical protein FB451DRAFT_1178603 [Mycena latifolia]|nr:hypothetical protein FB451DRAFT_1178603 [Mycena latifolia]